MPASRRTTRRRASDRYEWNTKAVIDASKLDSFVQLAITKRR